MLKWIVNSGWWLGNRHSRESWKPRCCLPGLCSWIASVKSSWRPAGAIGAIAVLFALVFLSACTDYVSQIEDRYGEWNVGQVYVLAEVSSSSVAFPMSSSAVIPSSSSDAQSIVDPSTVVIGSITDTRDGQTYKTVTIGTQTWMAQNLNYETANSFCYNDSAKYCEKYGRLYTWAAANTACPSGWHLPTNAEFETLFTAVGGSSTAGTKLKSTSGWNSSGNGTDDYSFSALPAGRRNDSGGYNFEGDDAYFWSSTEDGSYYAFNMYLGYDYDYAGLRNYDFKNSGFSVRCVKD